MEQHRDFTRAELQRLLGQLRYAMNVHNRIRAYYGYSPLSDVMGRIINWLRADRQGDYEVATIDDGFELEILANSLCDEFELEYVLPDQRSALDEYIRERNEREGLDTPEKQLAALGQRMKDANLRFA